MGLFDKFPYTNFHELNLDWILKKVKTVDERMDSIDASADAAEAAKTEAQAAAVEANGYAVSAQEAAERLANGSPVVVTLAADMTDTDIVYLYMGSETGYTSGDWYYYNGTAWVSGGTYGDPAELNRIKTIVDATTVTNTVTETEIINPDVTKINGKYFWNRNEVSNANYFYVHLDVIPGDIITAVAGSNISQRLRFVDAYNGSVRVSSASSSTEVTSYTVPEGIDNIYISCNNTYVESFIFSIQRSVTTVTYEPIGYSDLSNRLNSVERVINNDKFSVAVNAATVQANEVLVCADRIDNKKNCSYIVWAEFSSFSSITISHGKTNTGASYIVIDDTYITSYMYSGSQEIEMNRYEHGLTISDFLQINVKVDNNKIASGSVSIMTKGGAYSANVNYFGGSNGSIALESTSDLTNVKMQYIISDMLCDVYLFGDSYVSLRDPSRFPYQLVNQGYMNLMINGHSGANSQNELIALQNTLNIHLPKYLVWTLGMNDQDTSNTYNANWKTVIDTVISICTNNGITPILATIPNTPTRSNVYKNEWVRNSGYRYVDLAKAVGAEDYQSSWYTGMLSNDNVHPTELGAKALAARFLVDVPEIV